MSDFDMPFFLGVPEIPQSVPLPLPFSGAGYLCGTKGIEFWMTLRIALPPACSVFPQGFRDILLNLAFHLCSHRPRGAVPIPSPLS